MSNTSKILWLDCATTGLNPQVASILELSYVKEVGGELVGDIQKRRVQPLFHYEDQLYGKTELLAFCKQYNQKFNAADPQCLTGFAFPDAPYLFVYEKQALTFDLPPPKIADPSEWILGKNVIPAKKALKDLIDYLGSDKGLDGGAKERWIVAGHNVSFDLNVLTWWAKRLLGEAEAEKQLLNKLNKFVQYDTLTLSRWFQYAGKVKSETAKLNAVAEALLVKESEYEGTALNVHLSREIAQIMLGLHPSCLLRGMFE